jgi:hypothetical protein
VKSQLESGGDLATLADTYSQYGPSKEKHGDLGLVADTENISSAFNGYVFNLETQLGVWSDPIKETNMSTKGGAWFIQLVDKEDNRALSEEDKTYLINKAYSEWTTSLWNDTTDDIVYSVPYEEKEWAINKALDELYNLMGS